MARKRQQQAPRRESRVRLGVAVLGVALVAVLAVGALVFLNRPSGSSLPLVKPAPPPFAAGTTKGLAGAPLTIIEYSDFQ
ncbi:MAG: hypothetical protein HYY01_13600 [Chloroflexi bacterium]|nr:hypothetical protein [Chloroflexota bacterium]